MEHNVNRCPKCGASEVEYDINKQKLVCNYCHSEFEQEKIKQEDLGKLEGYKISDGSKAITDNNDLIVLKCDNCGAEVVINSSDNNYRCHWCHSVLSLNSKIGNGMVPDLILPFKISKEEAKEQIDKFMLERRFFAKKKFKNEFTLENVLGVYFPYLLVDCNAHASFKGLGGRFLRIVGDSESTKYEIEKAVVERDFDIEIDDFEIEASLDKVNKYQGKDTKNVINSIMPFDTENCVEFNSNYLSGFTSEKRDLNVIDLQEKIDKSLKDIARYKINDDIKKYDSGIFWKDESFDIKGKLIKSAYLPVWLYSYRDKKNALHYIALNARTGEINGSIPMDKVFFYLCFIISLILVVCILLLSFKIFSLKYISSDFYQDNWKLFTFIFSFFSVIINLIIFYNIGRRYRNLTARHEYERETKSKIKNLTRKDEVIEIVEHSSEILFCSNNNKIEGDYIVKNEDV